MLLFVVIKNLNPDTHCNKKLGRYNLNSRSLGFLLLKSLQ